MANLLGQNIGTNYKGILNLDTINTPLDATLRAVTDGEGNASPLQLSTDEVSLEGSTSINSIGNTSSSNALTIKNSDGTQLFAVQDNGKLLFGTDSNLMNLEGTNLNTWGIYNTYFNGTRVGIGVNATGSYRLHIKGSGTTSGTTALLVQNSAGTELFKVQDNGNVAFGGLSINGTIIQGNPYFNGLVYGANFYIQTTGAAKFGSSGVAAASAILEASSTTRGFLPPRMTTTQKNAIATPASGLIVYDETTNKLACYNGTTWNDLF